MALDPTSPVPPNFKVEDLREMATTVERWSIIQPMSPEMADYYRQRACFYRAEAVRRMMAEAL